MITTVEPPKSRVAIQNVNPKWSLTAVVVYKMSDHRGYKFWVTAYSRFPKSKLYLIHHIRLVRDLDACSEVGSCEMVTYNAKTGHGYLREVVAYERFQL